MSMEPANEYHILPVTLVPKSKVTRHIMVKRHESESCPPGKSLFILNVPPLVTTAALKQTFTAAFGKVSKVEIIDEKTSIIDRRIKVQHKSMAVVFNNVSSVEKIFQIKATDSPVMSLTNNEEPSKLQNFVEVCKMNYNNSIIPLDAKYNDHVNKLITSYEKYLAEREKTRKEVPKNEADEEGWITVKHKGKHSLNKEKAIRAKDKIKQMKKKRIESNVSAVYQYRMRSKEEKFARLRELRAKFEEDKFKLAQMKAGRKFKPV